MQLPTTTNTTNPFISVVICTRNRGSRVVSTIESVLANRYEKFEVILVDQSSTQETQNSVQGYLSDPRFRYLHSDSQGAGRAHNIGMKAANGSIIASTDDDCIVPKDWLSAFAAIFEHHSQVAVVFCNVLPAEHDSKKGFIPTYIRQDNKIVRTMRDKCHARGIGAGMALRRDIILGIGGFDDHLGPGSLFRACNDGDVALRALIHGWWVYETHEVAVIHDGFRTWKQGQALTARAWYGIGAAYAKPLKCGHWRALLVVIYEGLIVALLHPLMKLFWLQRPQGLKRFLYFWQGFLQGMKTPVDRKSIVFQLE